MKKEMEGNKSRKHKEMKEEQRETKEENKESKEGMIPEGNKDSRKQFYREMKQGIKTSKQGKFISSLIF